MLRKQFGILKRYFDGLSIDKLKPISMVASPGALAWALSNESTQWVVYTEPVTRGSYGLTLILPKGGYRVEWMNVLTGAAIKTESFTHTGAAKQLTGPTGQVDVVVKILKQ